MESLNLLVKARANRIAALNGVRRKRIMTPSGRWAAVKPVIHIFPRDVLPAVDAAERHLSRRLDEHFASRRAVSLIN